MSADSTKSELLQQLRIDRGDEVRSSGSPRQRQRWLLFGLPLLLAAGALAYWLLRGQAIEVQAAQAVAPSADAGTAAVLQATGYVTARREATVSAQITGALTQVLIEEGEHVKSGQILARLDDSAQKATLSQAQAQQAAAGALVQQYQEQLQQARRDNQRNQDLIDRNLVSRQALETSQTQVATLTAQLLSQQRQVELAQAQVQGAQVELDYTIVRAPFDGVIIAKAAQAGEIISPISAGGGFTRTGVGTIVDMDSLEIEVDVNEAYINRVQPNQSAQAVLDAYPNWTIPAHVIAIIPTADRSKATVKVRIGIDQKDARILPDMGVRVSFLDQAPKNSIADAMTPGATPQGVLVPASSIVERDGKSVVFVIEQSHARAREVNPGQSYGDLRIVAGIAVGATLVRTPPEQLRDGSALRLTEE